MYHSYLDSHALSDHLEALRQEAAHARRSAPGPSVLSRLLNFLRRAAHLPGTVQHT